MELREAIVYLKKYQGYLPLNEQDGVRKHAFDLNDETVDAILAALPRADEAPAHPSDTEVKVSVAGENCSFEDFVTARNDEIDNAAHALLCALSTSDLSWDMEKIGALVDYAEGLLTERGADVCHPFYEGEDETPCIRGADCKKPTLHFSRRQRRHERMSYIGGGPYHAETCPVCGGVMWNGRCEDPDCEIHWHPIDTEDEDGEDDG